VDGSTDAGYSTGLYSERSLQLRYSRFIADLWLTVLPTLRTRLGQRSKNNASPTLIYVAGAALRVADVVSRAFTRVAVQGLTVVQTRVLKTRTLRGDRGGEIAKLFARHIKLEEHVTYLKRTKIGAAVGTSGRLGKLLEIGLDFGSQGFRCAVSVSTNTHHPGCFISRRQKAFSFGYSRNQRRGIRQGVGKSEDYAGLEGGDSAIDFVLMDA